LLEHWQLALDFLLNSADHCLLLIPLIAHDQYSPETIREMCAYIEARGAKLLKTVNNEQNSGDAWALYLRSHPKPFGGRVHWNRKKLLKKGSYIIKSDFSGKKLYKPTTKKWVRWQRGINLRTFLALQGSYPTKEMVLTQLRTFQGSTHNDLLPCNMVIQGSIIIAIDFDDPRRHLNPNIGFNRLMKVYG
jgi:hypothetical protein